MRPSGWGLQDGISVLIKRERETRQHTSPAQSLARIQSSEMGKDNLTTFQGNREKSILESSGCSLSIRVCVCFTK